MLTVDNCTINDIMASLFIKDIPDEYYESNNFSKLNSECITFNKDEFIKPMKWNRFMQLSTTMQLKYVQMLMNTYDADIYMLSSVFETERHDIKDYFYNVLHVNINKWCCRSSKKYDSFLDFIKRK